MRFAATWMLALTLLLSLSAQADDKNTHLEAIGAMGAMNLYLSYSYIGATADGFVAKAFKAKQVRALMTEVDTMLGRGSAQLTKVAATKLAEADKRDLHKMISVAALLRAQAAALMKYAGTGSDPDAKAFEASRQAAWAQLSALLGLKK